ncbi:hypothetical protein HU200_031411 [Digitaria exilis]|uniref:RBR-type E3 ubiquitin transferase n=1 Tax=Digitaria exilis TaxID=1010633 RepID=A0A835EPX5_9POAL|nr:hypothetical protein HU200_031411 [Digitaria exilis]CAB3481130.1 unnamed protein product [Digitaria exilis]
MAGAEPGQHHHDPCSICMESMAPSDAHRGGAACAHAFCGACLSGHVRAKVETTAAVVRCPDPLCGGALDPELCRASLPSDVFERWCAALCESLFAAARRTYCPFPDCSEMMVADDDDGGGGEDCVAQCECQVCRRLFCARCHVAPWHAGVACDEYQRLDEGDRGKEDMMLLEMAKGNNWKRCPNCQFIVEKVDGCALIRCRYRA